MSATIKLTGGKAVAAMVVVVGIVAFQLMSQSSTVGTEAADQVKIQLASDYTRFALPEIQRAAQSASVSMDDVTKHVATVSPDNIEIVSIRTRGSGDGIVARVVVKVGGKTPPDGRSIRYFRLRHSVLTGWMVNGPTTPMSYYLAFL